MPTKCMDQMPVPMARAPHPSHSSARRALPMAAATREAMSSATNDATTAVATDSNTSTRS